MNWKDALEPGHETISAPDTTLAPDEQEPELIIQIRDRDFDFGPDHESEDEYVSIQNLQP